MLTKKQLLAEVREYTTSDAGMKFRLLLQACIEELRIRNDTATTDDFLKHQGAIEELKAIAKGISIREKMKEFDGAFGE